MELELSLDVRLCGAFYLVKYQGVAPFLRKCETNKLARVSSVCVRTSQTTEVAMVVTCGVVFRGTQ